MSVTSPAFVALTKAVVEWEEPVIVDAAEEVVSEANEAREVVLEALKRAVSLAETTLGSLIVALDS